jgi:exopolyphosphatase/guanosine-5'-triphosphate,3'-diphosphate pyrophosphatase
MWDSEEGPRVADGRGVIDAAEEARLIYAGARQALGLRRGQRAVLFAVGSESTRAILDDGQQAQLVSSLELGARRLRDHWLRADPPSPEDAELAAEWVHTVTASTLACFRATGFDVVALTSASAVALARVAGRRLARAGGIDRYELTLEQIGGWQARLACLSAPERTRLLGKDADDTLLAGAVIARSMLESLGAQQALVCDAGVGEALIADHLARRPIGAPFARAAAQPAALAASSST